MELLRSLSNYVQTFNFLSIIFLDVKKNPKKQQHKNPKTFSCLASIISHTCRQRCSHLTGRRQQAKAEAYLLRLVLVIQGWKSGANQAATKRGKNSKHQTTSTGGDHTGCPLPVWFSSFTNQHVTVKRGVKNGTKGLAKPFINLPDQPDSEGQANGLLIRWASHEQHKARWKETKPCVALRRAVGYALWLIMGWEEGGQSLAWNPSKTQNPCDSRLMRVPVLILSKTAPITRTRGLAEQWLCTGEKRKHPLGWLRWSLTKEEEYSSKNVVNWQQDDMLTTLCCILSHEKAPSFISTQLWGQEKEPGIGRDLDSLAVWPLRLSFI